jgi:uncharacterized membrane protein YgcG
MLAPLAALKRRKRTIAEPPARDANRNAPIKREKPAEAEPCRSHDAAPSRHDSEDSAPAVIAASIVAASFEPTSSPSIDSSPSSAPSSSYDSSSSIDPGGGSSGGGGANGNW